MDAFHVLVREARKLKGLTQNELASRLRVTGAYIAKLEKGGQCPSPGFLENVCNQLDLDLTDAYFAAQLETEYPERLQKILSLVRVERTLLKNDRDFDAFLTRLKELDSGRRCRYVQLFAHLLDFIEADKVLD
jgi:transcriptional regulator with XRE-family HTH domain